LFVVKRLMQLDVYEFRPFFNLKSMNH